MQNNENKMQPVGDEELDNVSGGWLCGGTYTKVVGSEEDVCEHWECKHCGRSNLNGTAHTCSAGVKTYTFPCQICKYCEHRLGSGYVCMYSGK